MTPTQTRLAQRVALWVTLAGALVVRLWYATSGLMDAVTGDAANYDGSALRLLAKGYFAYATGTIRADVPNAFTMPGFTLFLAGLYRVFGVGSQRFLVVYVAQAILSTVTILLIYLICRRLTGSPGAALCAAAIAAVYPPFIVGSGIITTEALFTFMLTGVVWLAILAAQHKTWWWFLAVGFGLGLATLIRPTAVPWALALAVYLMAKGYGWRRAAVSMAALALGFLIVLTPWWVRNYTVLHRFVVFNSITANPLFRSTYLYVGKRPTFKTEWPYRFGGNEFALNDYHAKIAAERVGSSLRRDAVGFVLTRLDWTRAALVAGWAVPREGLLAVCTSIMQVALLVLFLVAPLLYRRSAEIWLVWTMPVLLVVVHTLILALPRYIFPAMPFVIALASATLLWVVRRWTAWAADGRRTESRTRGPAL